MKTIALLATFALALGVALIGPDSPVSRAATDAAPLADETHDVAVTSMSLSGPGAVNLSDSNGRYMWVVSKIANNSGHTEMVNIEMSIGQLMPAGCIREESLVVPAQKAFLMYAGETKTIVWRVRYECHSPATFSVARQTVTVGITHCEPSTSLPGPVTEPTPGGVCPLNTQPPGHEADVSNNTLTATRQFLVK